VRLADAGDDDGQVSEIRADGCTSHISVVDSAGTAVALTQTLLSPFGSKIVLPQSGILMNNGIMWFDPRPGRPNSIGAGKRPLSNMCPTIVETSNGLRISLGASGGRRILPAVLQLICFLVDHGMSAEQAIHQPRIDVGSAEGVAVDCRLPDNVFAALNSNFNTSWAHHSVYPALFACPNMAVWDAVGKRAYGATYVPSPRAAVAGTGEHKTYRYNRSET
jgi:gamma-glutamyltranspeptidase/glutathione hydrolase